MSFEEDSYVQIVAPNGDYRYGYVAGTEEKGEHLTICMHEEGDSKLAYENAADLESGQSPLGRQHGLSPQELRVLTLLSKDPNTGHIAHQLNLKPATVRSYLRTLQLKLRVSNRVELGIVAKALVKSLSDTPEGE